MTRRPSRALARSFALALSLVLVGSALVLPAAAVEVDPPPPDGINSPSPVDVFAPNETITLSARVAGGSSRSPSWALRQGADIRGAGSTFTRAGNVDGATTGDLNFDSDTGVYSLSLDLTTLDLDFNDFTVGGTTYSGTTFFFVFNWDGTADNDTRDSVEFTISPLADFDGENNEIASCGQEDADCTITQEGFTASTDLRGKDGGTAFLGLRLATEEDVAEAVSAACEVAVTQVNPQARLGPDVVQLVPLNFAAGSITVQSTIPRSFVNNSTARGAGIFQVCVAAETDDYAGFELDTIGGTNLFGPIILDDCDETPTAADACVLDRSKNRGDVVLTYQLPTEDPWLK